jgi:hypothetical protein
MKKHCANNNNALTIGSKITCPTATVLETPSCINPLVYLVSEALITARNNNTAVDAEITALLNAGVSISNGGKFCCPGCNDIYYLGYSSTFQTSLSSLTAGLTCCLNYIGDPAFLNSNDTLATLSCCSTNFLDCITAINQELPDGSLTFGGGLMEYNSINSESSICLIYNQLKAFNKYLTGDELADILDALFTAGVVIKCTGCTTYIGSAADYFNTFLN